MVKAIIDLLNRIQACDREVDRINGSAPKANIVDLCLDFCRAPEIRTVKTPLFLLPGKQVSAQDIARLGEKLMGRKPTEDDIV